jgi:hypothetical protein
MFSISVPSSSPLDHLLFHCHRQIPCPSQVPFDLEEGIPFARGGECGELRPLLTHPLGCYRARTTDGMWVVGACTKIGGFCTNWCPPGGIPSNCNRIINDCSVDERKNSLGALHSLSSILLLGSVIISVCSSTVSCMKLVYLGN